MNYPYYYDQATGAPSGRFSAPMSRANIRNPITPYGIAYTPPEGATSEYAAPTQQQPSRLRRAANFLGRTALIGGALYAASQLGKGGDDGVTPVDVRVETPVRDRVQDLLKSVPSTGDVDVEGNPINPKQYDSAPRSSYYPSGRGAGGDYLKGVSTRDFKAAGDDPSAIAAISIADPEEVGGLRTKKSKDLLSKFRKNILTTEGRPQTEHAGLDEEIVGVSPEQAALGKTWAFVDNDRFFDHPDTNTPGVPDEVSNVPDAGKQHLDSYASAVQQRFYPVTELPNESSHVSGVTLYPQAGVTTWNLRGRDGGTSPYSYHTPEPVMEALTGMSEEGTLSNESLGGIHNTLTGRGSFDPAWGKEKDLGQMLEAMREERVLRAEAKAAGTKRKAFKSPYGSLLTKIDKFDPDSPAHLPGSSQRLSKGLEDIRYD